MPTYHEIMTTDLSALTTAADKWTSMAGEFGKREKEYEKEVHGITLQPTWIGQSSEAANARFRVTLNEYKAAQAEAKAIASCSGTRTPSSRSSRASCGRCGPTP